MRVLQPHDWLVYARAGMYLIYANLYDTFRPISPTALCSPVGKMLRLHGIGREFESRGGIITFCLFYLPRFLSQLTSISVIIYICWPYESSVAVQSWGRHTLMHYAWHRTWYGTLSKNVSGILPTVARIRHCTSTWRLLQNLTLTLNSNTNPNLK